MGDAPEVTQRALRLDLATELTVMPTSSSGPRAPWTDEENAAYDDGGGWEPGNRAAAAVRARRIVAAAFTDLTAGLFIAPDAGGDLCLWRDEPSHPGWPTHIGWEGGMDEHVWAIVAAVVPRRDAPPAEEPAL